MNNFLGRFIGESLTDKRMDTPPIFKKAGYTYNMKQNKVYDKDNNSVDLSRFSDTDAVKMLSSLKHCKNCKDCFKLRDCKDCMDCMNSTKLSKCYLVKDSDKMIQCEKCINCSDCKRCEGLTKEDGLSNVKK